MQVIVPLAGPDFIDADGRLKALVSLSGTPLLLRALSSRPWANSVSGYTFILKDGDLSRGFVDRHLKLWYPDSTVVYLSDYTRGAACSALAGVACQANLHCPVIVDLADILYSSFLDVVNRFQQSPLCGGLALTFCSSNPIYSYLRCNEAGDVIEAAEKSVISSTASAGTYIFRDSSLYLRAVAHAFDNAASQVFNDLFYVCPLFNGVIAQGYIVESEPVYDVFDCKT